MMKKFVQTIFITTCLGFAATSVMAASEAMSDAKIKELAASVKVGEVTVYSFNGCSNCAQTKAWLHENGFKYTECNVTQDANCARVFREDKALGAPYVVVRGHQMKQGFNKEEFLSAL